VEEETRTLETIKKENADLKRELRARPTQVQSETKIERVEVPIITDEQMKSLEDRAADVKGISDELKEFKAFMASLLNGKVETLENTALQLSAAITDAKKPLKPVPPIPSPVREGKKRIAEPSNKPAVTTVTDKGITGPQQRILDAIAWFESIGIDSPSQVAVAFLAN
jgi:hypothetical protein